MTCQIAIQGPDTLVGQNLLDLLIDKKFPANTITLLRSQLIEEWDEEEENEGVRNKYKTEECLIENHDFSSSDILFTCDKSEDVEEVINEAVSAGVMIIDLAGFAAQQIQFPLIIANVNSHELQGLTPGFIVALPAPASAMSTEILHPLLQYWDVERVSVSHFNPAAALGKIGVDTLAGQTARLMNGMPIDKKNIDQQLAFNLLPQSGAIDEFGFTEQEAAFVNQTRTLLNNETLPIAVSFIQAPVFYAQSQLIEITFSDFIELDTVKAQLAEIEGIDLVEGEKSSPASIKPDQTNSSILVSRVRQNESNERVLTLWCAADSLRRCQAGNAVQIAEILIKSYL